MSFVLLQNNFDLGIGIILNLRLSVLAIFSDIITTVVNQGEFDKVVPFLQKARVTQTLNQNISIQSNYCNH